VLRKFLCAFVMFLGVLLSVGIDYEEVLGGVFGMYGDSHC